MAFTITKSDGTPITVAASQDNTYALILNGTGSLTYPQNIAQNFIRHLENFASPTPPPGAPLLGQLWYDTSTGLLKVYEGVLWVTIAGGGIAVNNTDDLPEGSTNLYYTNSRVRTAISVSGDLNYNSNTGVISFTATPLYTDANARAAISVTGDLSYNPSNGVISYTTPPAVAGYTDADARAAISVTGNLTYNSNTGVIGYVTPMPYTDANARAAISVTGDLSYNQANGVISYSLPSITPFSQSILIACSDETTAITSGKAVTMRVPIQMTLTEVRASLTNAQTTGNIITVDVRQDNVSILSTLLTIDNNEKTSLTAATPAVLSNVNLVNDAELTIYVTNVDAATTAAGLKVALTGYNGSAGFVVGYTGSAGPTGSAGGLGYTGSMGSGYTGSQGTTGYTGSAGTPGGDTFVVVTGNTQVAVNKGHYALTNVSTTTVTLPGTPSVGDAVTVTVANSRVDNIVASNGSNIMAYASDLTLNIANSTTRLRYINSNLGWWIV